MCYRGKRGTYKFFELLKEQQEEIYRITKHFRIKSKKSGDKYEGGRLEKDLLALGIRREDFCKMSLKELYKYWCIEYDKQREIAKAYLR